MAIKKIRLPDRSSIDIANLASIKPTDKGIVLLGVGDVLIGYIECQDDALKLTYLDILSDLQDGDIDLKRTKDWSELLQSYKA